MKKLISDKDFCNEIKLTGAAGRSFHALVAKKQYQQAALHAARSAFAQPFAHPIDESEIPAMAKLINKEIPDQIERMELLANKYWLKDPKPAPAKTSAYEHFHFHIPNTTQRTRGIAVYSLCRLYHLTQKKKYFDAAMKMMYALGAEHGDYPQGDPIGFYGWHPHTSKKHYSHTVAHMAQEFNMMLPFIRQHCSDTDKLYVMKFLWTVADVAQRAFCKDQSFNLTLHFMTACHQTALVFPCFKQSTSWIKWSAHMLKEYYQGNGVTADGYFREGVLYQRVNHHLLELNYHFMKASGQTVPKKMVTQVHAAHQLNANICGPDGSPPLIGDSAATNPHEHWIHTHEALHLAAALENNPAYKNKAGTPFYRKGHERNFWEMGLTPLKRYLKMPWLAEQKREQKPADHGKSGFQILGCGTGKHRHFGALLYTQNHNHSHFDIGSIHLYSKGRQLISDPSKASYGTPDGKDEAAQSHSLAMLPRFSPAGPRLHAQNWAKTKFALHKQSWQAASMEHALYDGFRMQRTLVLINKGSDDKAFWVVLDKISPDHKHPLGLHELVDTSFHFNAVETHLGIDGLQCWSKHDPKKKTARRYKETDTFFNGSGEPFNIQECRQSFEFSDSPANLQVAGFALEGTEFSLQEERSHTCEFGGRVQRPAALFKYRGPLPTVLAYVLVPFNGIRKTKPTTIDAQLSKKSLSLRVNGQSVSITDGFSKQIGIRF